VRLLLLLALIGWHEAAGLKLLAAAGCCWLRV
jgi:hypothetical protein